MIPLILNLVLIEMSVNEFALLVVGGLIAMTPTNKGGDRDRSGLSLEE